MVLKKIFLSSLILIFGLKGISQFNPLPSDIPSPNALGLGLYGQIPVSYFTGVPDISIPLYQVKGNKLELPITLNYHASGLKPDIHPGWVGNGWSLMAGGVITRKVNGLIDEYSKSFSGTQGYYFNYPNLNNSNWASSTTLSTEGVAYNQVLPPDNTSGIQNPFPQIGDVDTQPDEFIFNFYGYSGEFFLDQTGNWQVQCDKPIKIIFDQSDFVRPFIQTPAAEANISIDDYNVCKTFGKFTIIDERGNKYIFGSTDIYNTAIEFSDIMIPQVGHRGSTIEATSWYLSQIISADGSEIINLDYVRGPFTSYIGYQYSAQAFNLPGTSGCNPFVINPGTGVFSGRVIFPVYLSKITMPSQNLKIDFSDVGQTSELQYKYGGTTVDAYGKVFTDAGLNPTSAGNDFPSFYLLITNSGIIPYYQSHTPPPINYQRFIWLQLNSIKIVNSINNSIQKKIVLNYTNTSSQRLRLGSINILGSDNQSMMPSGRDLYAFEYNSTPLPDYITIYGDHWGFNNSNGANYNYLSAGWTGSTYDFFTPRIPDASGVQTQAEILKSITYPTGGTTNFIYEPNKYGMVVDRSTNSLTPVSQSGIGGGLRIKQIVSFDPFHPDQNYSRTFYYVNNYSPAIPDPNSLPSSGVLDNIPKYTLNLTGTATNNNGFTNNLICSNSQIPLVSGGLGVVLGYSTVIEKESDGRYTIYEFTNHDQGVTTYNDQVPLNTFNNLSLNGYQHSTSSYYARGKLLNKTVFDKFGNYKMILSNTYAFSSSTSKANSVFSINSLVCSYNNIGAYSRTAFQLNYTPFLLTGTSTKLYSSDGSNNAIEVNRIINYDSYQNVVSDKVINSKGQIQETKFLYPVVLSSSDPANPYSAMINMNNVSSPIEKIVSSNGKVVSGEFYSYKYYNTKKVYLDAIYNFESSTPFLASLVNLPAWTTAGIDIDDHFVKSSAYSYDEQGNISFSEKTGNESKSYIWDNHFPSPVAVIDNAKNISSSGQTGNVFVQNTYDFPIPGNPPFTDVISTDFKVAPTGPVKVTFSYNNPYISGTNNTFLGVKLVGVSNPSYVASTAICAETTGASGSCGSSNIYTFTSVPTGTYKIVVHIITVHGFSNYYGYTLKIEYGQTKYEVIDEVKEVAYTSFESDNKGNWSFSGTTINDLTSPTGLNCYDLGQTGGAITRTGLSSSDIYFVTYWIKGTNPISVSGTLSGYPIKRKTTTNGWTCYEHKISGISSVSITGSKYIDELRLYPVTAQITSYTYLPLLGISSKNDNQNHIEYYEYDNIGRLLNIRDQDKNIIKAYDYKYQSDYNQ